MLSEKTSKDHNFAVGNLIFFFFFQETKPEPMDCKPILLTVNGVMKCEEAEGGKDEKTGEYKIINLLSILIINLMHYIRSEIGLLCLYKYLISNCETEYKATAF